MNHSKTTIPRKSMLLPTATIAAVVLLVAANWNSGAAQDMYRDERRPSYRETDRERRINDQLQHRHFKSGGQQSEATLQQILVVLQRMDRRLENLERVAESMQSVEPNQPLQPPVSGRPR